MRPWAEVVRRTGSMRRLASIVCCVCGLLAAGAQRTGAQQFDYDPDGYWKMPSPPAAKGEFGGEDPIGLASRRHIPTDCAINWTDEAGKMYCFSSSMSSKLFQDERVSILPKAVAFWADEHAPRSPASQAPDAAKDARPAEPR